MKIIVTLVVMTTLIVRAEAMSMGEAVRYCFKDGSKFCPSLGHGKAMRACLNEHFEQLTQDCQAAVVRLNRGENLSLF